MRLLFLLLSFFILANCSELPGQASHHNPGAQDPHETKLLHSQKLETILDKSLDILKQDNCSVQYPKLSLQEKQKLCSLEMHHRQLEPRQSSSADLRSPTIMVVESEKVPEIVFLGRYRYRYKSVFDFVPDKDLNTSQYYPFQETKRTISLPKTLVGVFNILVQEKYHTSNHLKPLNDEIEKRYPSLNHVSSHTSLLLPPLLEDNPLSPLVYLELPDVERLFTQKEYCEEIDSFKKKVAQISQSIVNISKDLQVSFRNMSMGYTASSFHAANQALCEGMLTQQDISNRMEDFVPLLRSLLDDPLVFTAQASYKHKTYYDCDIPFSSRLKVGYFSNLRSDLKKGGQDRKNRSPYELKQDFNPFGQCADIYLNTGVIGAPFELQWNQKNYISTRGVHGLGLIPYPVNPTTSGITPLLISYAIYLKRVHRIPFTQDGRGVERLKQLLVPNNCGQLKNSPCIFQDPLFHGQVMSIHLKSRSKIYNPKGNLE